MLAQSRPGYVYDYSGILFESEKKALESLCLEIDVNTSAEVLVVVLEDLGDYGGSVELAKLDYFNEVSLDGVTGVGKAGLDNGVLLLIAVDEREWGFEVGYGVEGLLTDSESGRIGREVIAPYFQEGEYYYGLFIAVALVGEELGYDSEGFSPIGGDDLSFVDVILEDPFTIIWWIFGLGADFDVVLVLLFIFAVVLVIGRARYSGGGGRSGGGGSRGTW